MLKKPLPVFTRDHRTGSMKEFTPGESNGFALASDQASPPWFRVLVAGDDEPARLVTIWHLGQAWPVERDMLVECAADAAEALEKVRSHRFELVVLGWNLPHQDGAVVLRAMREDGLRVPVVVVSGQRRETIASDLEEMAAALVIKNELDSYSFRNAIVTSMRLQEGRRSVGSGHDTSRTERVGKSSVRRWRRKRRGVALGGRSLRPMRSGPGTLGFLNPSDGGNTP